MKFTKKQRRRQVRGDGGSVMMEFIIVLPIYLCLFGGLFLTGEVLLAREKLWGNDRMLAWLCGFYAGDDLADTAKSRFSILTDEEEDAGLLVDEKNKRQWAVAVQPPDNSVKLMVSNQFLALYSSHMALKMKIPAWIRGPLAVTSIFSSGKDSWSDFSLDFDQLNNDYDTHDNARHYLFKRVEAGYSQGYDRDAEPAKLMGEGIVWNVAGDSWPSDATASSTAAAQSSGGFQPKEYNRLLTDFGE